MGRHCGHTQRRAKFERCRIGKFDRFDRWHSHIFGGCTVSTAIALGFINPDPLTDARLGKARSNVGDDSSAVVVRNNPWKRHLTVGPPTAAILRIRRINSRQRDSDQNLARTRCWNRYIADLKDVAELGPFVRKMPLSNSISRRADVGQNIRRRTPSNFRMSRQRRDRRAIQRWLRAALGCGKRKSQPAATKMIPAVASNVAARSIAEGRFSVLKTITARYEEMNISLEFMIATRPTPV